MMNRFSIISIVTLISLFTISSKTIAQAGDGGLQAIIHIQNVVNGEDLKLNSKHYITEKGDTFTVHLYKYYISNIRLIGENGKEYIEDYSYHLVNQAKTASKEITLKDIPEGKYKSISFTIGVDSLHNVSGAQSGDLDPINAMFWDWNTGYIMAKLECFSPDERNGKEITFHIGGYAGNNSVLRNVALEMPGDGLYVSKNKIPVINIQSDVAEWFKSPGTIDFSGNTVVTIEGKEATSIADNYADMFTIKSVEN